MLKHYGYIFLSPGSDPTRNRFHLETGGLRTTLVAIPDRSHVVSVAQALVAEGVQLLDLCGAFGPVWAGKVVEAVGGKIAVGSVNYGLESVPVLAATLKDE